MKNKLPIVSIVGRRNVGKSTLFNALIKQKIAIVDNHPGLTRDIISYQVHYDTCSFMLSDTPGLDLPDTAELSQAIVENAYHYLEKSSVIILLFENPVAEAFDTELLAIVRKLSLPTIIAVNKMDNPSDLDNMANFYEIGATDMLPISSKYNKNLDLLIEKISTYLPQKKYVQNDADIKIALVGRPNSGKSTLLNTFVGYERSIVSDIPGTTRDTINDIFHFYGKTIEILDTAGIRKKRKIKESVEFFSLRRTISAIEKADVVLHMLDATVGLTETDKKIADEILKAHKPILIAINKWDAIEKDHKTFEQFKDKIIFKFYRAADFPIISISAKDKTRIHKLITLTFELLEKSKRRIDTPTLNKSIEHIQRSRRVPGLGIDLKIYYATQIDTIPPKFIFFVNNPDACRKETIRFLEKELQKMMDLKGIPIVIQIKGKEKRDPRRKKR